MDTDLDLQDLMLEAQADLAEIVQAVIETLAAPRAKRQIQLAWSQVDPERKEAIRTADPDKFARFESFLSS